MNRLSVRARLLALASSLIVCFGGANLLLGDVVRQQGAARELSWQQHRKVETIHSVVAAMSDYRFQLGHYNGAVMLNDAAQIATARQSTASALEVLEQRLALLESFDAGGASAIRDELAGLPELVLRGSKAFADGERDVLNTSLSRARASLSRVDQILQTATAREQQFAEEVRREQIARAHFAQQASLAIVMLSSIAGIALGALLLRSLMRPLNATVHAMRQVNEGQVSVDLPPITPDEFGEMALALRQFRDQTERLRHLAYVDPLTGLGTRTRLEETLDQAVSRQREHGQPSAILFIGLDSLRGVNDSLGHRAGDLYLCEAANRLQRFLPFGTVLCRFGGDKFVAVLEELPHTQENKLLSELDGLARTILSGVSEPFPFRGELLPMSLSIGIALCPHDGHSADALLTASETAMYAARRVGGNAMQFAKADLRALARDRLQLVSDLRRGLEAGELEVWYQPIVNVVTRTVVAVEALLRWQHPQRGLVLPGAFVPIAEETGLIRVLGEHCLNAAIQQAAAWQAEGFVPRIAVNVSARQIEDRTIIDLLSRTRAQHGCVDTIDLELTETAMLEHIEHAPATLAKIRALGYRISVDDFGTGYSSLSYVQRFPIDKIKIDRSFVARIEHGRESRAIISTTTALARHLDLECVAEGVETAQQMQLLLEMDCVLQQGFYFSRALPADTLLAWARRYESTLSNSQV